MADGYPTKWIFDQTYVCLSKLHQRFQLSLHYLCIWTSSKFGLHFQNKRDILVSFSTQIALNGPSNHHNFKGASIESTMTTCTDSNSQFDHIILSRVISESFRCEFGTTFLFTSTSTQSNSDLFLLLSNIRLRHVVFHFFLVDDKKNAPYKKRSAPQCRPRPYLFFAFIHIAVSAATLLMQSLL